MHSMLPTIQKCAQQQATHADFQSVLRLSGHCFNSLFSFFQFFEGQSSTMIWPVRALELQVDQSVRAPRSTLGAP